MLESNPPPAYDSPLELRILAGDVNGVMDLIDAMSPAERAASWPAVEQLSYERYVKIRDERIQGFNARQPFDNQSAELLFRAMAMASFLCNPGILPSDWWKHVQLEDLAAYRRRYNPAHAVLTHKELHGDHRWHYGQHIHRAVIAGLVERPDTEEYMQSLFFASLKDVTNVIVRHVDADPGIAPYLLALFEREGAADTSFAASDKYVLPELTWNHAFLTLCERGVYTRAQLLDRTLSTLESDFPQFKANWFSNFHGSLAPTLDEMAERATRYLALCHSRIAPTVGLALDVVTLLYKAGFVDNEQLCEALQPVLTSAAKGRVLAALGLLEHVVKTAPEYGPRVSAIAVHALGHSGSDVQKKTIVCLQSMGLDDAGADIARGYLPFVAAVNHAALLKLTGGADPGLSDGPAAPDKPESVAARWPGGARLSPLAAGRAWQPLTALHDVVEHISYALENPVEVDEWERACEALVRMGPIPAQDRPAFLALKKRVGRLHWQANPLGYALGRLLASVLDGEVPRAEMMPQTSADRPSMEPFIALRTHSLIAQAGLGVGLAPLSAPTHRGGFIDPRILVARVAAFQKAGVHVSLAEQVFALLRLVPAGLDAPAALAALEAARLLADQAFVQALRYALGDSVGVPADAAHTALFVAAARIRSPDGDDQATLAAYGCLGPGGPAATHLHLHVKNTVYESGYVHRSVHVTSTPALKVVEGTHFGLLLTAKLLAEGPFWWSEQHAGSIRFAASMMPSNLEPFFAEGVRSIGNNLDWYEARWQNSAYFAMLLQPTTPLGPMARLVLAFGLAGKEPGQSALAVDALVSGARDGRLSVDAMGDTLAQVLATPFVKGPRLGKSLAAAALAHVDMPPVVFALLCAMFNAEASASRKDLAALLELMLELKLGYRLALPANTSVALAAMRLSGKSKLAVKAILT